MVKMEEIQAAMDLMRSRSVRLKECVDKAELREKEQLETNTGGLRGQVLKWFVETQASLILCDGNFPTWFRGFISRQEAEDQLRDKYLGCFLIRLSEKASGYILSYKGQDRCRHFVINQTKDGMLVVSGDSITHSSLPQLIEYFRITPIQPFGECLVSEKEEESPSDDLYDVVQCKPTIKPGVSVQALRSLWDQRSDVTSKGPPALPPKSSNRKLTSSNSIDRNNIVQMMPPALKRNLPLRSSLSGGHPSHGTEQPGLSHMWPSKMGIDEGLHQRRRTHPWESEGFSTLDSHLQCYSAYGSHFSTSDGHHNSQSRSLPHLDEDHCSHSTNASLPASPHTDLVLPKLASFISSSLLLNEHDTNLTDLQPNPLYQTSSGLCAGHNCHWGPHSNPQLSQLPKTSSKPMNDTSGSHNAYQDNLMPPNSNTYEDLPMIQQDKPVTQENNTYEDLPEIQQSDLPLQESNTYEDLPEIQQSYLPPQESNTYEDIPGTQNNTYASVDELQQQQQPQISSLGKKTHKWWKFKPENKKK